MIKLTDIAKRYAMGETMVNALDEANAVRNTGKEAAPCFGKAS